MRKLIGIAAVALFFVIILALVLFKLLGSSSKQTAEVPANPFGSIPVTTISPASDPGQFTHDFYAWYLSNAVADPSFPSRDQLNGQFTAWLTPTFISGWYDRADAIDANPVLYAQDSPAFWGGNVSATTLQQDANTATVKASVGNTQNLHIYTVHLVFLRAGWRIDSVEGTL